MVYGKKAKMKMKSVSSDTTQKTCSRNTIEPSSPKSRSHVSSSSAPLLNSIGFQMPSFASSLAFRSGSLWSSSLSGSGGSALLIGLCCGISKFCAGTAACWTGTTAGCCCGWGNCGPIKTGSFPSFGLAWKPWIFASNTLLLLLLLNNSSLLFPFSSSSGSCKLSACGGGAARGISSFAILPPSSRSSQSGPPPWSIYNK